MPPADSGRELVMRNRYTDGVRKRRSPNLGAPMGGRMLGIGAELADQATTVAAAARIYGVAGSLEVRLARTRREVEAAQRLRYEVFYEELDARAGWREQIFRRDADVYDGICDHLLVIDHALAPAQQGASSAIAPGAIVGTYRMLSQDAASRGAGFYSQAEFDLAPLIAARGERRLVEVGRSCVRQSHRSKRVLELLWHGLWTYVREHRFDTLIGCASFPGTDPELHAEALGYLCRTASTPSAWHVEAHRDRYVSMVRHANAGLDARVALRSMPPLIKGYLRLGAFFGDGAVIDRHFGTTDVLVVLPVERIDPRYFSRFGLPDEIGSRLRHAPAYMAQTQHDAVQ